MADANETETTATATSNETSKPEGNRGRRGGKRGDAKPEHQIEVVARGKGRRADHEAITVETVSAGPVLVNEDMDFAAFMAGTPDAKDDGNPFASGRRVRGIVETISPSRDFVFLDLGAKTTGYISKSDVSDSEGNLVVKPGDEIEGIIVGSDDNGIQLRVKLGAEADLRSVREAFEAGLPVEGRVVSTNKGGYEVHIAKVRAFCPHSQIDIGRVEQPETMVGQTFTFKITEIKDNGGIVVSRAALLKAERGQRAAEVMSKIGVGARMKGRVRSIQKFGVFVDLGGKDGLVHVSELSWNRVEDPHTLVKLGDEVEVVVTEVDLEKDKIGLSMKRAQQDPMEELGARLQVGEITTGTVSRIKDFGAFIALGAGIEGLVHISDLAHYRVRHPKDILTVGETVRVKVLDIDLERRQFKLSLKALAVDPWETAADRYQVGQTVTGKVDSVQEFGVFISLEPGVNALLPASESKTEGQPLVIAFKPGSQVEARILRVDANERKIALTRRDEDEVRARPAKSEGRGPRTERMNELGVTPKDGSDWNRGRVGRRDEGGSDRRSGNTLAYSDTPEKGKAGEQPMSAMAQALMKALKKDK
jgi:small subunit ribosomal protein S1